MLDVRTVSRLMATPQCTIDMNVPTLLLPELLLDTQPSDQPILDLASESVQRYVWQGAYGAMLVEVRDGIAFVNGHRVASMAELLSAEA